jgi:hypothetical protein
MYDRWLVYAAVYFGCLFATGLVATIVYDLIAAPRGWRTVSRETMYLVGTYPVLAVLIAGCLGFSVGVLVGHLFFAQVITP